MSLFVAIVFLLSISPFISSQTCSEEDRAEIEIVCEKVDGWKWHGIGERITCEGDSSISSIFSYSSVSSVEFSDESDESKIDQITALSIQDAAVKFIPSDIKSHFTILQALQIIKCGLLSVNKENMEELGNSLLFLSLSDNKLMSIEADLFEYNPNLKVINLSDNPIRYIDPKFFTNLESLINLEIVQLNDATCMNEEFNASTDLNIAAFKWNNEDCTDETAIDDTQKLIGDHCYVENKSNNIVFQEASVKFVMYLCVLASKLLHRLN